MKVPTHEDAFQVVLLQAADEGRGSLLFGESLARLKVALPPFLIGESFPDVYFEHPLIGAPFIDATVLYGSMQPGQRVHSLLAGEHAEMFDWFASASACHDCISIGFELDTKEEEIPVAAVHFQPRDRTHLVRPFCEAIGEPEKAELYLSLAARMPEDWPLAFFGLFRGRAGSPLRVCGYLDSAVSQACAQDATRIAQVFDAIGFDAYNDAMLAQIAKAMSAAPSMIDFQFDVYPDGRLGTMFALDLRFGVQQPEKMRASFENGCGARVMGLLEDWGAADSRWRSAAQASFARALPVELPDGTLASYAFTLMPQWVKVRWVAGRLQPSKLYHLARGSLYGKPQS